MVRYPRYINDEKTNKQTKILYIDEILKGDIEQEFTALEMIDNADYQNYDIIIFKYSDKTEKRIK